jgi:DNA-binding IclR family transcriptional regulator
MACIKPDGKPTHAGLTILRSLEKGALPPEEVSRKTVLPLFRVRSGLRELADAGYVEMEDLTAYVLSTRGREVIATP